MAKQEFKTYKVQVTTDYRIFRELEGNRNVLQSRVDLIKKSIESVGYIINPIIVNERLEIIDGQGRFNALKQLGMPVYYIVQHGIGLEECRSMNIHQKNWTTMDYVNSYATSIIDYKYLKILKERFEFQPEIIVYATSGYDLCATASARGNSIALIKCGEYTCNESQYKQALDILEWLTPFRGFVEKCGGRKREIYNVLIFCWHLESVDNDKLLMQFSKYYHSQVDSVSTLKDALDAVDRVYAFNRPKKDRVYIAMEYDKYIHGTG